MAYTKTPMSSTDQTETITFTQQWQTRDISDTKDTDSINVVWDIVEDPSGTYSTAIKREGLTPLPLNPAPPLGTNGLYSWDYVDALVTIGDYGSRFYRRSDNTLISSDASVSFNYNRRVGFTEFSYEDGTVVLIVTDGINIVRINGAGVMTKLIDVDMPQQHRPYPVFLDGYLFLADLNGNICNSNLNNPDSWSAADFLAVDAYPDGLEAIARHGSYIAAFGASTIQFFYDAANPTGTPLAVYSASTPQVGFRGGLVGYANTLIFTGVYNNGTTSLFQLDGFKVTELASWAVKRRLDSYREGAVRVGAILSINGHNVYTWNDRGNLAFTYSSIYGLDLDTKLWTKLEMLGTDTFNFAAVCRSQSSTTAFTVVAMRDDPLIYIFSPTVYQDNGMNFNMQFRTKNYDFASRRNKFAARLLLNADQTPVTSFAQLSWTDDDYQTYSTERSIDLAGKYTQMYAMGNFRKRAWKIRYTDNYPMRFTSMELDYQIGQA